MTLVADTKIGTAVETKIGTAELSAGRERKNFYKDGTRVAHIDRTFAPSRVFIDLGESVWEHLNNRHNRDWQTLKPIVAGLLWANGIAFEKLSWDKHAGCKMCACSGGFVIKGHTGQDFWLSVR